MSYQVPDEFTTHQQLLSTILSQLTPSQKNKIQKNINHQLNYFSNPNSPSHHIHYPNKVAQAALFNYLTQ